MRRLASSRDYFRTAWSHCWKHGPERKMAGVRIFLLLALGLGPIDSPSAPATPTFNSSEIEGQGSEIIFCDLDGDQLKDAVLVDGLHLSIFYQDPKEGFNRRPQQQYH